MLEGQNPFYFSSWFHTRNPNAEKGWEWRFHGAGPALWFTQQLQCPAAHWGARYISSETSCTCRMLQELLVPTRLRTVPPGSRRAFHSAVETSTARKPVWTGKEGTAPTQELGRAQEAHVPRQGATVVKNGMKFSVFLSSDLYCFFTHPPSC